MRMVAGAGGGGRGGGGGRIPLGAGGGGRADTVHQEQHSHTRRDSRGRAVGVSVWYVCVMCIIGIMCRVYCICII